MPTFTDKYRELFDRIGYPLSESNGLPESTIIAAADSLGRPIPSALADYFRVAGNLRRLNSCFHKFIAPKLWSIDQYQLIFLDENQSVCSWGISVKSKRTQNPIVSQATNEDDRLEWNPTGIRCFDFISIIIHCQVVNGGFRYCAKGESPDDAYERLRDNKWNYAGELNGLWAFNKPNQVVCIMHGAGLPFMPDMMLLAAGKTKRDLTSIESSLGIPLQIAT